MKGILMVMKYIFYVIIKKETKKPSELGFSILQF